MSPFLSGTTPENDVSADVSADVQDQEQSLSPSNSNYVENPSKSNFVVSDASVPAQLEQAVAGAHDIIHDAAPLLSSARSPIIRADLCTVAGGALPRPESVSRAESAAVRPKLAHFPLHTAASNSRVLWSCNQLTLSPSSPSPSLPPPPAFSSSSSSSACSSS